MSLIDDFKTRFTQFYSTAVDASWPGIDPAYQCYYGVEYGSGSSCDDEIILVLCAHLFTVQTTTSSGPSLVGGSKSVGNVSVSYNTGDVSNSDSFFLSTKYGQQFLQMTNSQAQGGIFV